MIFASPFDERLFHEGPPALFTLDPKGKLRVDPERTREAYLTVTPDLREEAHYVLTDKVTRLRLYVLVTHPSLATATAERSEATRYGTYEEAREAGGFGL